MNNKTINAQELIDFITKHKSAIFNEYDCYKDHIQSKIKWNMRNEDMFNKLITVINGMTKDETKETNWDKELKKITIDDIAELRYLQIKSCEICSIKQWCDEHSEIGKCREVWRLYLTER